MTTPPNTDSLASKPINFSGQIRDISGDSVVVARLREIGFARGETVEIRGKAPFGDPFLVEIRGAIVALRKSEAQCVKL